MMVVWLRSVLDPYREAVDGLRRIDDQLEVMALGLILSNATPEAIAKVDEASLKSVIECRTCERRIRWSVVLSEHAHHDISIWTRGGAPAHLRDGVIA